MTDIMNWAIITGNIASRSDIKIIRKMDATYLRVVAEERKAAEARMENKGDG